MPVEGAPFSPRAGQIVLADWPGDARAKEPNKRRLSGRAGLAASVVVHNPSSQITQCADSN